MVAPCVRDLVLRRLHELQQPVVVPCEFLSLHADSAEERLVEPEHIYDDVPEHREILRDILRPRPRPVLVEVHVQRPVHRLDSPVRAYRLERVSFERRGELCRGVGGGEPCGLRPQAEACAEGT